jgi:hypothetical protein
VGGKIDADGGIGKHLRESAAQRLFAMAAGHVRNKEGGCTHGFLLLAGSDIVAPVVIKVQ